MHAFFIAMGPGFREGAEVTTFDNVDVYPLMCHLLGLHPAPNNGSLDAIRSLLREEEGKTTVMTSGEEKMTVMTSDEEKMTVMTSGEEKTTVMTSGTCKCI